MKFILFLDEVGAEFTHARANRKEIIARWHGRQMRERPLAIRPIEVFEPNDKPRRAARGFLIFGPAGAAIGVLTGKGPAVRFALEFADGARQGVIAQKNYPRLKHRIAKMQIYRSGDLAKALVGSAALALACWASLGAIGLVVAGATILVVQRIIDYRRLKSQGGLLALQVPRVP